MEDFSQHSQVGDQKPSEALDEAEEHPSHQEPVQDRELDEQIQDSVGTGVFSPFPSLALVQFFTPLNPNT